MRHALFVPPFDGLAEPERLVELAVVAEESGWDGLFLWDHLLYPYGPGVRDLLDPYVCLGALALATSHLVLGPMVTPLARRRPAVLARQTLTLERLSHGRLVLGLGLGDDEAPGLEFSRFGDVSDPRERARALDEGLEVLTGLLSGARVDHHGPLYQAHDVAFSPTSERPGGIPLWIAGRWPHPRPIARAARFQGMAVIDLVKPSQVLALRSQLAAAGADLDTFEVALRRVPGDDPRAWERAGVTWLLHQVGPFSLVAEEALHLARRGPGG